MAWRKVAVTAVAALRIEEIAFRNLGELSGGQRRLVALSHALAREPRVLQMDEPTSALDLNRKIEVLSLVIRLARQRNMAILIALHDLNHALRFCSQVIVIAEGQMVACDRSADVITPGFLRQVYGVEDRVELCSRSGPHVIIDGHAV